MARVIKPEQLADQIRLILSEYEGDVLRNSKECVRKVGSKGVQALKSASMAKFGGTGKYAAGWTQKVTEGRFGAETVLHNATTPGLPHLLEHGHAKRGGGRVPGRAHIKPVEETMVREFENMIEAKL